MKRLVTNPFRTLTVILMLFAVAWLATGSHYIIYSQNTPLASEQNPKEGQPDAGNTAALPFDDDSQEKAETNSNAFGIEYISENTMHVLNAGNHLKHENMHFARHFIPFIGDCASQPPENFSC